MVKSLKMKNVRCFDHFEIDFDDKLTYIYGKNGCGKTTILEAIYLISTGKSFRSQDESTMIKNDKNYAEINLETSHDNFRIVLTRKGKRIWINKKEVRKLSNFVGKLKSVLFSPDDIEIIKGKPQRKRKFINLSIIQFKNEYIKKLKRYHEVLKKRNTILKIDSKKPSDEYFEIITKELTKEAKTIIKERSEFIEKLNKRTKINFKLFSDKEIRIIYKANCELNEIENTFIQGEKKDRLYETTLNGPHRDTIEILFDGNSAKEKTSQGQQRLIAFVIKMSVLDIINEKFNEKTIFLLDDILSELDADNQGKVLKNNYKEQQIIMNSTEEKRVEIGKIKLVKENNHEWI